MTALTTSRSPDLLFEVAQGNEAAFAELFEQQRDRVYFISYKVLKSAPAAEDAVQEIFLKIWNERSSLSGLVNFQAWLNTVIRNYLINRLRKQSNEIIYLSDTYQRRKGETQRAEDAVEWNTLHKVLLEALGSLSPQQRKVFELARVEGYKQREIAGMLGISVPTVKVHMANALQNITNYFTERGYDLGLAVLLIYTLR